jgi:proteasome assembly chaperone (PAC2) family protein
MNVLKKEGTEVEKDPFEIYQTPQMQSPSLIVSWQTQDSGKLGSKVTNFLNEKLGGQEIAEIKPLGFFAFGGIRFKDDLVQAPECQFWAYEKDNLLVLKSDEPLFEHYRFLNLVLDFAEYHCQAKEVYTLSGALSYFAHTNPRKILTVFNRPELKTKLQGYGLEEMTWEGPPAISSYLLWVARRRGISGVSLWPEIPFYLAAREDPQAIKVTLSFLNRRFDLGLDLEGFDSEIKYQNEKIAQLRREDSEINKYISMLESGQRLNEEEQLKLARGVYELFSPPFPHHPPEV